jgi:hypothetical protein
MGHYPRRELWFVAAIHAARIVALHAAGSSDVAPAFAGGGALLVASAWRAAAIALSFGLQVGSGFCRACRHARRPECPDCRGNDLDGQPDPGGARLRRRGPRRQRLSYPRQKLTHDGLLAEAVATTMRRHRVFIAQHATATC